MGAGMKPILMAAALVAMAAPARADDAAANAVYERMQAAYTALDPSGLETVYAPDATYLSRGPQMGIDRRDTIIRMTGGFHQRMRQSGGQIAMKFRLVERKRFGDVYVDNGYIRTTMKMSKDAPEQVTYGKFVTVIAKQPDGHWAFVSDADSDTPAANFDKAQPVAGLKFDK